MRDINCPYCDAEIDINHDDGYEYIEDRLHQQECSECDKIFVYTTSISFSYDPCKADCLNGGKHEYKLSQTYPKKYSKMVCSMCEDERPLTESEITEYKINVD